MPPLKAIIRNLDNKIFDKVKENEINKDKKQTIMILSVGEILVDMMGNGDTYTMHVGGAPFNVAVGAKRNKQNPDCTDHPRIGETIRKTKNFG